MASDASVFHPNVPDVVPRELTYANARQSVIIESWDEKILPEGRATLYSFSGASNAPIIPIYGQTGTAIDFQDSYIVVWLDARLTKFIGIVLDTRAADSPEDSIEAHPRNYNVLFTENVFCIFREIIIRNGKNAVLQRITDMDRIRSMLDLCSVTPEERISMDGHISGFGPEETHMKDPRKAFWKLRFKFNIGILDMEELYPIGLSSGLRLEFKLQDPAVYMRTLRQHRFQFATSEPVDRPNHPNAFDIRADLSRQGLGWSIVTKVDTSTARIFPLDGSGTRTRFQEYTCPFSHNANNVSGGTTEFGTQGMHQSLHPQWKVEIVRFEAHIRYKRLAEDFWRAQLLSVERLNEEGFSGLGIPFKHYTTSRREFSNVSQLRFVPQLEEGNTDALIAGIRYARHERGDMSDWLKEGLFTMTPFVTAGDAVKTLTEGQVVYPRDYVWKIGGESFPRNRVEFDIDPSEAGLGEPSLHEIWRELRGSLCPHLPAGHKEVTAVGMLDKWSFGSTAQAYPWWRYHQISNRFAETDGPPDSNLADSIPVPITGFPNSFGVHESAYGKSGSLFGSGAKSGTAPGRQDWAQINGTPYPASSAITLGTVNTVDLAADFRFFLDNQLADRNATAMTGFAAPEPYMSMFTQDILETVNFNDQYSVAKKMIGAKNPHTWFCADLKKARSMRWFDGRQITTASLAPEFQINFNIATPNGLTYVLDVWAIQSKLLTFWPEQREAVFG